MKRRLFLTGLFATGATVALADPAHARRRRGGRRRSYGYGSRRRRRIARSRSSYQTVSSSQPPSSSRSPSYSNVSYSRPSRPVVAQARPQPQPQMNQRRTPGHIERNEVATFRLKGKTRRGMMQQYGQPDRRDGNQDIWNVANTSDGIRAPGRFIVTYDGYGKAVSARTFGY